MIRPRNEPEPDALLVERFRRGEKEAFSRIVALYRQDVYRIARRMTGNHEDADDVAQETFLRAYRALGGFRGDSSLKTWLFRIALNQSVNLVRSRSGLRAEGLDPDRLPEGLLATRPEGEDGLLDDERARRVRGAIGRLPPRQRQVVVLRVYEEMKFHEIAELLEAPLGTVKANFFHAMANLRKALP